MEPIQRSDENALIYIWQHKSPLCFLLVMWLLI